jgi:hypothetical protein
MVKIRELTVLASLLVLCNAPVAAQNVGGASTAEIDSVHAVFADLVDDPRNRRSGPDPGEGWIQIPGKETSLRFGGYVQANYIHDFQDAGYQFGLFIPSLIPVPTDHTPSTQFDARSSRLTFETQTPTRHGKLSSFVSMDFAGDPQVGSIQPRLRQAYVSWTVSASGGNILFGQSWTTFMDLGVWPELFDLEGPNAMTGLRQGVVRYSFKMGGSKHWLGGVALEQPATQVRNGIGLTDLPDALAQVTWSSGWGHLEVAGLARQLVAESTGGTGRDRAFGWGLSLSGSLNVPGTRRELPRDRADNLGTRQDNFKFQIVGGSGVGRYVFDLGSAPEPQDAIYDAATAVVTPLDAIGGFGAYQHWWADMWRSTLVGGYLKKTDMTNLPPDELEESIYAALNVIYRPFNRLDVGLEYYWGQRTDKEGSSGHANRCLFSVNYVL